MTYCVGLRLKEGLVMLADTRTNAGVDNIATFKKSHLFEAGGERVICAMTSGNLAITQAVINLLTDGFESAMSGERESLYSVGSMFRAAELAGEAVRKVYQRDGDALEQQDMQFSCGLLLGGQIKGRGMRLFQVYSAGNFIEATADTPFLQIGEHKYGKPILDRACSYETALNDGVKLAMISMDSTLRSNLTVGMPLDLVVYKEGNQEAPLCRRVEDDDPYFLMIRDRWSTALRDAYRAVPPADWLA